VSGSERAVGLHHLLLQTSDLEAAERFFLDVLGFTVRKREAFTDGRPLTVTEQGLGLTNGAPGAPGAVEHVAFRVSGVRALAERARAAGATILKEPGPGPYGLTVYVADPDGNRVELFAEDEE
jgi:catechol 2,3-dioxygenase-like lactoylglutathione lyase family enzyme